VYKHEFIPAMRCKELRRGRARLGSDKLVCAGLYDFVMLHYADDVRCMRCSCGCTVSDDMKKKRVIM
jgi:hypothetical protein